MATCGSGWRGIIGAWWHSTPLAGALFARAPAPPARVGGPWVVRSASASWIFLFLRASADLFALRLQSSALFVELFWLPNDLPRALGATGAAEGSGSSTSDASDADELSEPF